LLCYNGLYRIYPIFSLTEQAAYIFQSFFFEPDSCQLGISGKNTPVPPSIKQKQKTKDDVDGNGEQNCWQGR